jgi:phosphate starvation-inducible PhoH-like protein
MSFSGPKEKYVTKDLGHFDIPEGKMVIAPLFGPQDQLRRLLERRLGVKINARGQKLTVKGPPEKQEFAIQVVHKLLARVRAGSSLFMPDIDQVIGLLEMGSQQPLSEEVRNSVAIEVGQGRVTPKSPNQKSYLDAMVHNDLVFATGPAGTGKTYLAMAAAVSALRRREVERIILARPAVEAGERLGFLPGSLSDKVNPYLRPLHDALFDLMGLEPGAKLIDTGVAEVAPLAFMRGRTLNRAFVILDEAQNTTREQMKMFLTRLGYGSRAIVTGDITQIDLERGQKSGLVHVLDLLRNVPGIGFVQLESVDVVRHGLVRAIVQAYDAESNRAKK